MTIPYQQLYQSFTDNQQHVLAFYLPNGAKIPKHFHVTDVGSVFRHFIDCGGQVRDEAYVQIQLWLGKDTEHRLNGETVAKILTHSQVVLDKLPDLANAEVLFEYKEALITQYAIAKLQITASAIEVHLAPLNTQCLAANRHEAEVVATVAATVTAVGDVTAVSGEAALKTPAKQAEAKSCCAPDCCS